MRQYFYLIGYDAFYHFEAAKIFLQEHEAVRWGRRLATKNPDYSVKLYKQEITRTGKLEFVKQLKAFNLTPEEAIKLWVRKVIEGVYIIEKEDFPDILYTEDNAYMYAALQELLNIDEQAAYRISTQIDNTLVEEAFNHLYPTMDVDDFRKSYQIQEVFDFLKGNKNFKCPTPDDIAEIAESFYYSLLNYIGPATASAFEAFAEERLRLTGLKEQQTHFRK